MKIFTVRHGQTTWNSEKRIQGQIDIPLDEAGIEQAHKLGKRLAGEQIEAVYTSDLLRAAQTAEIINSYVKTELVKTEALREISFGIFEGRIYPEIADEIDRYRNANQAVPGGEHIDDFFRRVQDCISAAIAKHSGNLIFVGHHGTVRAAICFFMDTPVEDRDLYRVDNTALHCFEKVPEGYFVMTLDNDTSHLKT